MSHRPLFGRARWTIIVLLTFFASLFVSTAQAQYPARYFKPTGHYVRGAFRSFWERNGDLANFGYPLTEEYVRNADGKIVQYFERARFELTVRNNQAFVELGRLGADAASGRNFPAVAPVESTRTLRFFPETGHTLRGAFKSTWDGRGGAPIFGVPISEEIGEQLGDGRLHTVQYFERARFELWADGVRLTQLGRQFAPPQLLEPWPDNVVPGQPLSEDGLPRPPGGNQAPAGRAAIRVAPDSGGPGQTFTVQGEGFQAAEGVSLWLSGPDSVVQAIDQRPTADANGSISAAGVRFSTEGFRAGRWAITGQGLTSGRQAIGEFRIVGPVGDPNRLGIVIHPNLAVSGPGAIVPLAAVPGNAFTFTATGFDPGEKVGAWLTRPNGGGLEGLDERLVVADGKGGVRVVFGTQSMAEGIWTITAQGVNTKRAVTAPFKLTRDYFAPLGTARPASRNGTVSPAEGGQRAIFRFTGSGFRANEPLEHWITSPDGLYYMAGPVTADARGRIGFSSGLAVRFSTQNAPGVYGYHFRGSRSGAQVDLYMTYNGAP